MEAIKNKSGEINALLKEKRAYADTAYSNGQYGEALKRYDEILKLFPNDLHSLMRAGFVSMKLQKSENALHYFDMARKLAPNIGDIHFNYGNACFVSQNLTQAFQSYAEAERLGCSDIVKPRMYYQLALIYTAQLDFDNALVYYGKCEEADKNGDLTVTSTYYRDKIKLLILAKREDEAIKEGYKLVMSEPDNSSSYTVLFMLLLQKKQYKDAEKVLNDAFASKSLSVNDKQTLRPLQASLYLEMGKNASSEKAIAYFNMSKQVIINAINSGSYQSSQIRTLKFSLADIYQRTGNNGEAIRCMLNAIHENLQTDDMPIVGDADKTLEVDDEDLEDILAVNREEKDEDELEEMREADMENLEDTDCGDPEEVTIEDEDGVLHTEYHFPDAEQAEENGDVNENDEEIPQSVREQAYHFIMVNFLELNRFEDAERYAKLTSGSQNAFYRFYSMYVCALTSHKLKRSDEERTYTKTLAYFRSQSGDEKMRDLALVFRVRLYAESGQYEKAEELRKLLPDDSQQQLAEYIEQCRKEQISDI